MKYIIAGNYQQFREWCAENRVLPGERAAYISRSEQLRGLTIASEDVVRCGTYYSRPDIDDIENVLAMVARGTTQKE